MSSPRRTLFVVTLALLGIALAAVITWGTSRLVTQRIGLASEPLTAGQQLLPAPVRAPSAPPAPARKATTPTRRTEPPAASSTTTSSPPPPSRTAAAPAPVQEPASEPPVQPEPSAGGDHADRHAGRDD